MFAVEGHVYLVRRTEAKLRISSKDLLTKRMVILGEATSKDYLCMDRVEKTLAGDAPFLYHVDDHESRAFS